MLQLPDDSGFLALIVPASYKSFVAEDWDFEQLRAHFRQQMAACSMLIWGTGLEGLWRVDLRVGGPPVGGFREIAGPIRVVGGSILVTSYDSLTMAAQYADVRLPQAHERDQQVEVPDGDYRCLVVQMFDPASESTAGEASPDFILVLSELSGGVPAWLEIPWFIDTEPSDYRLENDPGFLQRIARARESLQAGKGIRLEELKTKSRSLHRRTKRGS